MRASGWQSVTASLGPVVEPERLRQRLDDAAVIAGRMAHEFDNILTGIIGFADLTAPLVPEGSQASQFIAEIAKVGQRGNAFTQQLHQLSRSGRAVPVAGSVAAAVAKEVARQRSDWPAGVTVRSDIPGSLPEVGMESTPLGMVVGHLIQNAAEASPAGGEIAVTARLVELSPEQAKEYLGQVGPGPHVEMMVRDAGPGIKPEVRAKLFAEPFFTTKVRHRGLGLAVVYRTLFAHRGGVRLEPAPDAGTAARAVIPPAAARPAPAPAPLAAATTTTGG